MWTLYVKNPKKGWVKIESGNIKLLYLFAERNMRKYYEIFYKKFDYKITKTKF